MSLSHLYQDFGPIGTRPAAILGIQDASLEDLELEAFENGYKAVSYTHLTLPTILLV